MYLQLFLSHTYTVTHRHKSNTHNAMLYRYCKHSAHIRIFHPLLFPLFFFLTCLIPDVSSCPQRHFVVLITAYINFLLNTSIHPSYGVLHTMQCTSISTECRNMNILMSKVTVHYNTVCIYHNTLDLPGSNDSASQIIGLMKCKKESARVLFLYQIHISSTYCSYHYWLTEKRVW